MLRTSLLLRVAAVLLVFTAIVRPGDGLRCYQCNSLIEPSCAHQPEPESSTECEEAPDLSKITGGMMDMKSSCLKAVIKDNEHGGRTGVVRSCIMEASILKTCDAAAKLKLPPSAEIVYCGTCDRNLCNAGSRFYFSFLSLALSCAVTVILSVM